MASGLTRLAKVFGTPLDEIDASPRRLRARFDARSAAQLGLSERSFANIRSLAIQALTRYGTPDLPITRRFAMTPAWRERLDRIEKPYNCQALHRLAIYCSRMGLSGEDVTPQTPIGFKAALEAEEVVKDNGRCILFVPAERTKGDRALKHDLNEDVTALLRRFIEDHRPLPHAIAKIAVERDPGAYLSVSRVLGHTSLDTTMAHYLGTESKAAGRHLDRLLTDTKADGKAHQLGKHNRKRDHKPQGTA